MKNTKIEWADNTWNPLTGCYHGCPYCYARGIATRFASKEKRLNARAFDSGECVVILHEPYVFEGKKEPYPFGFIPTFHVYRLNELQTMKKGKTIFVCSMSDLFGEWVNDGIISQIIDACRKTPQHTYLFLTKNPTRYDDLFVKGIIKPGDTNFWLGSTVTELGDPAHYNSAINTFWSVEPILAPWPDKPINKKNSYAFPKWVILGAETGNRKNKVVPKKEWVNHIVDMCREMGVPIFMKDSLVPIVGEEKMIREFPWTSK